MPSKPGGRGGPGAPVDSGSPIVPGGPDGSGGHGGPGGPGGFGGAAPAVAFTFSADNSTVLTMTVGSGTRTRSVDISGDTFKTTVGTNDLGVKAVTSVERTHTETGRSDVTVFTDTDGNGQYTRVLDIDVLTSTNGTVETHAYTYAADGSVASDIETRGTHTHTESTGDGVHYQVVKLDGDTYVVRTETLGNDNVRFEITRDDNGDAKWTTLAHGDIAASAAATYVDATTGNLKLAGDTYVVRTEKMGNNDVRFEITRDDNGDAKWTTLAHGDIAASAAATYVDASTGNLKLAGVIDFLDPAAGVIG